jgi:hypothetical protein
MQKRSFEIEYPVKIPLAGSIDRAGAAKLSNAIGGRERSYRQLDTIGSPLYLSEDYGSYLTEAARDNPGHWDRHRDLLSLFANSLQSALDLPVAFAPHLALPGIQIFSCTEDVPYAGGVWHSDTFRHDILPLPIQRFSATMLLADGGVFGLEYERDGDTSILRHELGSITLFASHVRHRVAPFHCHGRRWIDRITLQGHLWTYSHYSLLFW